jgi:hypothetical protein
MSWAKMMDASIGVDCPPNPQPGERGPFKRVRRPGGSAQYRPGHRHTILNTINFCSNFVNHCLALQLRISMISESMGNHDLGIMDYGCFDRDDAGILGLFAAGCEGSDEAAVHTGSCGGVCGCVLGRPSG